MQDTNNCCFTFFTFAVKNNMTTLWKLSIAILNIVALFTNRGGFGQQIKTIIKLFGIQITLIPSLAFFGIFGNFSQVLFRLPG